MRLNSKVSTFISAKKQSGSIGIEIETELNKEITTSNLLDKSIWHIKTDGSLRGNGYEFVLPSPIGEKALEKTVTYWFDSISKNGYRCKPSQRTSIHVHRNVQDFTVIEALNGICTYWLAEPYLLDFCGTSRKGNNFCLTLQDADGIHSQLINGIKTGKTFSNIQEETYRYASLNIAAINRFGSLECRLMRGTDKINEIVNWSKAINQIIGAGTKFKNPVEIINSLTKEGPKKFLEKILEPDLIKYFNKFSSLSNPEDKLNENAMYIYEISEAKKNWDFLKNTESLQKDFEKLLKIKMDYLKTLDFKENEHTKSIALSMLNTELKVKGITDFNDFLEVKVTSQEQQVRPRVEEIINDLDENDDEIEVPGWLGGDNPDDPEP